MVDGAAFDGRLTQQLKTHLQVPGPGPGDDSSWFVVRGTWYVVIIIFINGKPIIFQLYSPLDTNCLICVCQTHTQIEAKQPEARRGEAKRPEVESRQAPCHAYLTPPDTPLYTLTASRSHRLPVTTKGKGTQTILYR